MNALSVQGLTGGIGTSTLSWAFALALSAHVACDWAAHQGGLAWTAGASGETRWPAVSLATDSEELEKSLTSHQGIRLLSGGVPIPWQVAKSVCFTDSGDWSVHDGWPADATTTADITVTLAVNYPHILRQVVYVEGTIVVGLQRDGVSRREIAAFLGNRDIHYFKYQRYVHQALIHGNGLDTRSDMSRCANTVAEQLL